jgi:hypothetical protein
MEMSSPDTDILRLERKLDLILDALGLGGMRDHRRTSFEIKEMAKNFIEEHKRKRGEGGQHECKEG